MSMTYAQAVARQAAIEVYLAGLPPDEAYTKSLYTDPIGEELFFTKFLIAKLQDEKAAGRQSAIP